MEHLLALLPALVCPIAMGLMMWMMMRGSTSQAKNTQGGPEQALGVDRLADTPDRKRRLELLRAHVDELKAQEALLAAQIKEGSVAHVAEEQPHPVETTQPEHGALSPARAA